MNKRKQNPGKCITIKRDSDNAQKWVLLILQYTNLSRPAGTWLVTERDAFLRGSNRHTIWTHYVGEPKRIKAYRVAVTGGSQERPLGTVRKLNYAQQVRRVESNALPAVRLELFFVPVKSRKLRRNGIRKSANLLLLNPTKKDIMGSWHRIILLCGTGFSRSPA